MNTQDLCFGQRIDPALGILEPWYTHGSLDKIKTWDLSYKTILEWGGGASTLWWGKKAKHVYSIDHNGEWWNYLDEQIKGMGLIESVSIRLVDTREGDHTICRDYYINAYPEVRPDICIVDGIHRYECAEYAIKVLKPEILIIDNHQQDYVFMCPALDELTKGIRMERFIQPDHTDHSGNPWATAIFYLNEHE